MIIYDRTGAILLDAVLDNQTKKDSFVKRVLMGDFYVQLAFNTASPVDFPKGSYVLYEGYRFELMSNAYPDPDTATGGCRYTLKFEAQQSHMKKHTIFWPGSKNREAVFHNTATLADFARLVADNMNAARGGGKWIVGTVSIENPSQTKLVSFNGDKCWDACAMIAEAFDTEWWTEENDGTVALCFGKRETGSGEILRTGEVVREIPARRGDDSAYGTRFFVFGSTRNLTPNYAGPGVDGSPNHVSEVRLHLPAGQEYIDARPDLTVDEIVEQVVFFEDIYPVNTDTVTSVATGPEKQSPNGTAYHEYTLYAAQAPFVPSDVITGATLMLQFTSGSLSGREFKVSINGNPETWDPSKQTFDQRFTLVPEIENAGDYDVVIPNASIKPQPGDTFVLTGVELPRVRIEEAEQRLLEAGQAHAAKNSRDTDVYDCPTNPVYCRLNNKDYELGQRVVLTDPQRFGPSGRESRIQGYEKSLADKYEATYTVGDNTPWSRLGAVEKNVKAAAYAERIGVADNGRSIYIVTRYDTTPLSDDNVLSATRSRYEFLSRQSDDTALGKIIFRSGIQFGDFASGTAGQGGRIDARGNAELESLTLRRFLNVPEMRYNRVEITQGDKWYSPGAGIIADVDTEQQILTLKLEPGEIGSVRGGDICMGIFHSEIPEENATEDFDDSRGNRSFAGFRTCYFCIADVLDTTHYSRFKYELREESYDYPNPCHPVPAMTFVTYGSFFYEERGSSRYETRTYQRYLRNVSDWEFSPYNIAAQFGDLSNLSEFGMDMYGYSAYLDNVYMSGVIRQYTPSGKEVPTIIDRGTWDPARIYDTNEDVYWNNARWRCKASGTKSEPSEDAAEWTLLIRSPIGPPGCILRVTQWVAGAEYHNDSDLQTNRPRYLDIVVLTVNNQQIKFQCESTHTSSDANKPVAGRVTRYWVPVNDMAPIYTPLLLADKAQIDFMQGMELKVYDSTRKVVAGLVGGPTPLFVGGTNAATAPFKVTTDGTLTATKANITGTVNANKGTIGGFNISNDSLTANTYSMPNVVDSQLYLSGSLIRFTSKHDGTAAYMGANTLPPSAYPSTTCPLRIENLKTSSGDRFGIYLDVSGTGTTTHGNVAIYVNRGSFVGFRPNSRVVSTSTTLRDTDSVIVVLPGTNVTLTLPANPQPNQRYTIRKLSTSNTLYIKTYDGSNKIYWQNTNGPIATSSLAKRRTMEFQYIPGLSAWIQWESSVT